jgi:phage-related protein
MVVHFEAEKYVQLVLESVADRLCVGSGCYELRVNDKNKTWRLFYFRDSDAIVILDVGEKKTRKTSQAKIELCQKRLKNYEQAKKQNAKKKR